MGWLPITHKAATEAVACRALPTAEACERVCVLIADPPADLAGLSVGQALRMVNGVGRGVSRTILVACGLGASARIGALQDVEVERVTRALQEAARAICSG